MGHFVSQMDAWDEARYKKPNATFCLELRSMCPRCFKSVRGCLKLSMHHIPNEYVHVCMCMCGCARVRVLSHRSLSKTPFVREMARCFHAAALSHTRDSHLHLYARAAWHTHAELTRLVLARNAPARRPKRPSRSCVLAKMIKGRVRHFVS